MSATSDVSLDRVEVRFATFRDAPAAERVLAADELRRTNAAEAVVLETCHRVELITVDAEPRGPAAQRRGIDAVRRVFEVVAGFDSAVVAEEQLLGQVRAAFEEALAAHRSGPILNELMRRALRFGRLVRSHARPGSDRSLADPAIGWLEERVPHGSRVAVVGTGEMGHLLARGLASAGHPVTVVSSSAERGHMLLESLSGGGHRLSVGPLQRQLVRGAAGLALAMRTRQPVITAALLPSDATPWIADLSAPPAVAPAAARRLGRKHISLDELGQRHGSAAVLDAATDTRLQRRLDDEVASFATWLDSRVAVDALSLLHQNANEVRGRHLARLRRGGLLDETQLAAVEAASASMFADLLHGPTLELRRGGTDAEVVRRLFALDA